MATEIWQWQTEANSQRNQEKRTFKNGLQNAEKCGQKFDATAGSHAEGPWSLILGAWCLVLGQLQMQQTRRVFLLALQVAS